MSKRRKHRKHAQLLNEIGASRYVQRFQDMAISNFEWLNLPETVDPRFLEMTLFTDGQCIFFEDEVLGFLALQVTGSGQLNHYGIPITRRAYANNGYQIELTEENSVIIYNNNQHTNSMLDVMMYADTLYEFDRIIQVNGNAQKTPVLLQCDEKTRMTLINLYEEYEGNEPVIAGYKGLDPNMISSIRTDAPYICDKIYDLKTKYWNECLTYLGISNVTINKKERLITDEVQRSQGGTLASRFSRLQARKDACKLINNMFGLEIDVKYRNDDLDDIESVENFVKSEENEDE